MPLHPALLKTLNLLTYIGAVSTIVYNRKFITEELAQRPNYLSNSPVGYIIPAINWFLLGGFTLVQWLDFAHDVVVEAMDWNLFVSNILIASWVLSWVRYFFTVAAERRIERGDEKEGDALLYLFYSSCSLCLDCLLSVIAFFFFGFWCGCQPLPRFPSIPFPSHLTKATNHPFYLNPARTYKKIL
jgi:hypothetical protein